MGVPDIVVCMRYVRCHVGGML